MSHTAFLERLKQYKGKLPPHVQEEYLRGDNTLDTQYLSKVLGTSITEARFRSMVNTELGTIFFAGGKNDNEVNAELFKEYYTFGTFPDPRGWIGYFHRVFNLVLTREKLYAYLTTK